MNCKVLVRYLGSERESIEYFEEKLVNLYIISIQHFLPEGEALCHGV